MAALVDVTHVAALPGYRILVTFEDGKRGVYDMTPLLDRGVFRRLRDEALFRRASVDYGTVVWPGGLDVAPETLWSDCVPVVAHPNGVG